jgi:hypothetical protein
MDFSPKGAQVMKNAYEVLRQKEIELARLEKEVEALRLVAPLLSEEKESIGEASKPVLTASVPQQPIRIPAPAMAVNAMPPQPARATGSWDETAKRWP